MVIKVGVNGFGRIGRVIFRTCFQNHEIELSAINDPAIDIEYICYLIKFDSTHGKFRKNITHTESEIFIDDQIIKVFREKLPSDVPWHKAGVQYVIEASGMFTCLDKASGHLESEGVKRVIITAPSVDAPMIILGVNDKTLHADQKVLSCASSTLYCLAPIVKVLNDHFGVAEGFITSIHAMTPSLKPLDGLCLRGKHWRDHRSIHQNIIPATTGACKALGKIIPQVKDKMGGLAFRVPIVNVSVLDMTVRFEGNTSIQDIIKSVEMASKTYLNNIIKISNEDAVSSDFIGDSHSCILDVDSSLQLKPNFYKLICWYENEYSYACRVLDSIFFSEKQYIQSMSLVSKMTYVRPKMPKKQDVVLQTENNNKEISIECDYTDGVPNILCTTSHNDTFKQKPVQKYRPLFIRKQLSSHNAATVIPVVAKKRNEVFKIWNDDIEQPKNTTKQNRGAFFRSCMAFSPKDDKDECMKAQERLESVKKEFSKMLDITEDLLKKSYSNKIQIEAVENISKEVLDFDQSAEVKVASVEDTNTTIKRKYWTQQPNNSIFKECGDFKAKVSNDSNEKLKPCNDGSKIDFKAVKIKKTDKHPNDNTKLTDNQKEKILAKDNVSNQTLTPYFKNENDSKIKPIVVKYDVPNRTIDLEVKVGKSIIKLPTQVSKPAENILTDINQTFTKLDDSNTSNKKYEEDDEYEINVIEGGFEPDPPCEMSTCKTQTSMCKPKAEEGNPEIYNIKDFTIYLHSKNYNMQIIDEELKKRNIVLVDSDSRFNFSNISGDQLKIMADIDDRRKNFDCRRQTLSNINRVQDIIPDMSRCDSPVNTETTISNGDRKINKQDLYDKLDSASISDSNTSFEIYERKSQIIQITDLTNSLEDLSRLDKICRIIEISDELSDKLFSSLETGDNFREKDQKWSFKDLCEKIQLDEFCNKVFGKTSA